MDLLDEDYREQAGLVANALVGVGSVFELQVSASCYLSCHVTLTVYRLQSPTPKNDFCRMFIREGLLDVSNTLLVPLNGSSIYPLAFDYSVAQCGFHGWRVHQRDDCANVADYLSILASVAVR